MKEKLTEQQIKDVLKKIDVCMCRKSGEMRACAERVEYASKQYAELKALYEFLALLLEYPDDEKLNKWLWVMDAQNLHRKIVGHFMENDSLDDVFGLV